MKSAEKKGSARAGSGAASEDYSQDYSEAASSKMADKVGNLIDPFSHQKTPATKPAGMVSPPSMA